VLDKRTTATRSFDSAGTSFTLQFLLRWMTCSTSNFFRLGENVRRARERRNGGRKRKKGKKRQRGRTAVPQNAARLAEQDDIREEEGDIGRRRLRVYLHFGIPFEEQLAVRRDELVNLPVQVDTRCQMEQPLSDLSLLLALVHGRGGAAHQRVCFDESLVLGCACRYETTKLLKEERVLAETLNGLDEIVCETKPLVCAALHEIEECREGGVALLKLHNVIHYAHIVCTVLSIHLEEGMLREKETVSGETQRKGETEGNRENRSLTSLRKGSQIACGRCFISESSSPCISASWGMFENIFPIASFGMISRFSSSVM
jgi:hypothetical protein